MISKTLKTLNLALISLLSIGIAASGQPVNFEASDVIEPSSAFSTWAADKAEVKTRDLEVRNYHFLSPRIKQHFIVGLGSTLIDGATWSFEMFLDIKDGWANVRGGHILCEHVTEPHIYAPGVDKIYSSATQYRGGAHFKFTGYHGTAQLVVEFVAEVFASTAATIIQHMITPPTAKLAGRSIPVTSWDFPTDQPH